MTTTEHDPETLNPLSAVTPELNPRALFHDPKTGLGFRVEALMLYLRFGALGADSVAFVIFSGLPKPIPWTLNRKP